VVYVDASALVKLVVAEAESGALASWVSGRDLVSSAVAGVEVRRAVGVARSTDAAASARSIAGAAEEVLSRVTLLTIEERVLQRASELRPSPLRTIDSVHLATALTLHDPEGIVTYDRRLADAARGAGLVVFSPGA
jgi:uncharacterized protein